MDKDFSKVFFLILFFSFTKLPVILKGILTKEDSRLACQLGVAGIIVSNHGARQVDNVPSSIEVLSEIVIEVNDEIPVMCEFNIYFLNDANDSRYLLQFKLMEAFVKELIFSLLLHLVQKWFSLDAQLYMV